MARVRDSFYRLLSDAIDDMLEHGFDTEKRLEGWIAKLRVSARASLLPESVLARNLADSLGQIFKRTISGRSLLSVHHGVGRFTIEKVKPKLRAELSRRIAASAQLITLNRNASIARTMQRFAGWGSSVPAGGSKVEDRKAVKKQVRRGIAALPFEERRVVIDQGHKLVAAISDIIATDGGAIAGVWEHVEEGPPAYDSRPDHVARDGKVYLLRDSWADKEGFVKSGRKDGYSDDITQPGEEVFCRCRYRYIYALRDLPTEMLTSKGKEALLQAREKLRLLA